MRKQILVSILLQWKKGSLLLRAVMLAMILQLIRNFVQTVVVIVPIVVDDFHHHVALNSIAVFQ